MSIPVRNTQTTVEIYIEAIPQRVYEHVTTPDNWRVHAFTNDVTGDISGPKVLGDRWIEVVRSLTDPEVSVETEWEVTRDEPHTRWAMSTDRIRGIEGAFSELAYRFEAEGTGTRFIRTWTSRIEGNSADHLRVADYLADDSPSGPYLEKLKAAIEA